jgi:hypothetical protein
VATHEDEWQKVLVHGHRPLVMNRRFWRHVPSPPRCKVCANPFAGLGGRVSRLAGYGRSRKDPNLCAAATDVLLRAQDRAGRSRSAPCGRLRLRRVAAHLQGSARSGEIVVACEVHEEVDALLPQATRRTIDVRGHEPIAVMASSPGC